MLDHLPPGQSLGCQMEVRFEKCLHQPERQRILTVFHPFTLNSGQRKLRNKIQKSSSKILRSRSI